MSLSVSDLTHRTKLLNRRLRSAYAARTPRPETAYASPPEVFLEDPLGPFPELNLFSSPCSRSVRGCCTPCFYSRVPVPNASPAQLKKSLGLQLRSSLPLVFSDKSSRVNDSVPGATLTSQHPTIITLALGLAGSFFSTSESDRNVRRELMEILSSAAAERGCCIEVLLESHARDIVQAQRSGELPELHRSFQNVRIIHALGLESEDELTRNLLYAKGLRISEFQEAARIAREHTGVAYAFVFVGAPALTEADRVEDCWRSLAYVAERGLHPILMFAHLQPFTLTHLLFDIGHYRLPDPWTVVACLYSLRETSNASEWLVAIEGGPPSPIHEVFSSPTYCCSQCTDIIRRALRKLRHTRNWDRWQADISTKSCTCRSHYEKSTTTRTSTVQRIALYADILAEAEKSVPSYLEKLALLAI